MSGPKTVVIGVPDACALILAAAAIQAAAAIAAGYSEAAALRASSQEARDANRSTQENAKISGKEALLNEINRAQERFEQLLKLAGELSFEGIIKGMRPNPPQEQDLHTLAAYVKGLRTLLDDVESILLTEAARRQKELINPEALDLSAALSEADSTRTTVQVLLSRVAHLGSPPEAIAKLASELEVTPPGERASLLAKELRKRIQEWIAEIQARRLHEAQSIIIEQTLKDLGYVVEGFEHTLFVEGGVVHFQKPGWGNYMARMRVGHGENTANFNVVRAVSEGENESSLLDHLAEDRWCAEFPALLKALELRGLQLTRTRHLAAGELPVQRVDKHKLPTFDSEDDSCTTSRPLQQIMAPR